MGVCTCDRGLGGPCVCGGTATGMPIDSAEGKFAVEEAVDLICGPRQKFYGPPYENLEDIARTWTPYVQRALEVKGKLTGTDVTSLMILLKCVRQARGYHRDSTADIGGYALIAEILNEPQARARFDELTKEVP